MSKTNAAPPKKMTDPSFEQQLGQLDGLVRQLEQGDLPLEEALQAFEHGSKLVKACRAQLDKIELRVEQIIANAGTPDDPATQPFRIDTE